MTASKATADRMNAIVRGDINLDTELATVLSGLMPCARTHTGYAPEPATDAELDAEFFDVEPQS